MDKFKIKGGNPLNGEVYISGAKNAALPILASSILCDGILQIGNLPHLVDIVMMLRLLIDLGVKVNIEENQNNDSLWSKVISLDASNIHNYNASYDIVRKMRASIIVLGPLLARFGKAEVSLPGGCAIGARPVNLHLDALIEMGAKIELDNGYIIAEAKDGLFGAVINFPKISVGATENIMMAATLAKGQTIINNAASEPEIVDLANCLKKMGAKISGAGTSQIIIDGVEKLSNANHNVIPDRIEAATFIAIAGAVNNSNIILKNIDISFLTDVIPSFEQAGLEIKQRNNSIYVRKKEDYLNAVNINTSPYPGFPTDVQAQFMAMMCLAKGESTINENIFENRFMHVPELNRMNADISIESNKATIKGVQKLKGAQVTSTDLRASSSLIIAGLAAEGETIISRIYHIDRGYDRIEMKLKNLGAEIERIKA
jgi:UDP-N-acetylglucosamine 1-carboxyvinyltransferase